MMIHKYKECESIPRLKLLDKLLKKEQRRKEAKEACLVISFAWLIGMAFMAQFVVEQETIADIFSVMLLAAAGLQALGSR